MKYVEKVLSVKDGIIKIYKQKNLYVKKVKIDYDALKNKPKEDYITSEEITKRVPVIKMYRDNKKLTLQHTYIKNILIIRSFEIFCNSWFEDFKDVICKQNDIYELKENVY